MATLKIIIQHFGRCIVITALTITETYYYKEVMLSLTFVCLSVCLWIKKLKKHCMTFDEIFRQSWYEDKEQMIKFIW